MDKRRAPRHRMSMRSLGPIRSLLVAMDLSETSRRALTQACALVPKGGRLVLVHVEIEHPLPGGLYPTYQPGHRLTPEERAKQREHVRAELERLVPKDCDAQRTVEIVDAPDVAKGLLAAAARHDVDLVCLGTHGHGALVSALLGSVASAVVAKSDRPVLLVPRQRG